MKKKIMLWIFASLFLIAFALAANDPGHDTLYIESQGDSELNGSLNITQNLTVEGGRTIQGAGLTLYGNGVTPSSVGPYISGLANPDNDLYLSAQGSIYLKTINGGDAVYIGSTSITATDLNVSGSIYSNNQAVCLADGTNCPNGGAGNVTSVTAAVGPLSASPTTGAVVIDITIPTCTGNDKLTYDGSSFSCATDQTGAGGDITSVNTNGAYLYGGATSNDVNLLLNESKLNSTIDARVTGGSGESLWTNSTGNATYTAGRVGIGTTTPQKSLEITSNTQYDGLRISNGSNKVAQLIGLQNGNDAGYLLLYDNDTLTTLINTVGNSYIQGGNLGIGTNNPGESLYVVGNINATGDICITGGNCLSTVSGSSGGAGWTNTSTDTYTMLDVGIGTSSPGGLLDVTFGTNNHITFQNTSTGNADDFVSGLGSIGFSRATDGALGLAGIYAYEGTDGATQPNLAIGARGDLVLVAGAAGNVFSANEIVRIDGSSGNVGIGTTSPNSKLHVSGNSNITGNLYVGGDITGSGADLAERIPGIGTSGDVVIIGDEEFVSPSTLAYDRRVAGIISSDPSVILSSETKDGVILALAGRVPVKVTNINGNILPGDMLTTSSIKGHAMKCNDLDKCKGSIVGKALTSSDQYKGEITALVMLG
jgi:hypothetical protein